MRDNQENRSLWWVEAKSAYEGAECLFWPFGRTGNGYGALTVNRRQLSAHRLMCEMANGPAPEGKPLALHSCGQGKQGCVNPKHLYWGSINDNAADAKRHGVLKRGSEQHRSKLTNEQVVAIRQRLAEGQTKQSIATAFGVRASTISCIASGATWAWLESAT